MLDSISNVIKFLFTLLGGAALFFFVFVAVFMIAKAIKCIYTDRKLYKSVEVKHNENTKL